MVCRLPFEVHSEKKLALSQIFLERIDVFSNKNVNFANVICGYIKMYGYEANYFGDWWHGIYRIPYNG